MISAADYYGLPQAVAAPPNPSGGPAQADEPSAVGTLRKGVTQDPVLVLVGLLFVAFLLARAAEHGLSLGFKLTAR